LVLFFLRNLYSRVLKKNFFVVWKSFLWLGDFRVEMNLVIRSVVSWVRIGVF
jgi:hypothetical protein